MTISPFIQRLTWQKVREEVAATNKDLFDRIEAINPNEQYSVYRVRYPFGAKIIDKGKFCLPIADGNCQPLSDLTFSSEITKELNYSSIPLALLLNKSCEVFFENKQHIISINLLSAKQLFGLFEIVGKQTGMQGHQPSWSMTAGARSIFMLPKITDMNAHRRIMRCYKVQLGPPKSLYDHWQIFTHIAKYAPTDNPWYCDVLFFSDTWMSRQQDSIPWLQFNQYISTQAWVQSAYLRNKALLNHTWELFSAALIKRHPKLKPYFMQAIKQLKAISYGFVSGYQPAGKSEAVAPIHVIENAYINDYELQEYLPIIMHLNHLNEQRQSYTCYYSFASETLHEGSFTSAEPARVINKLRQVKKLIEIFEDIAENSLLLEPYQNKNHLISYHYFHIEGDQDAGIQPSKELPIFNPSLAKTFYLYKDRIFPSASPFGRGCVSITVSSKVETQNNLIMDTKESSNLVAIDE